MYTRTKRTLRTGHSWLLDRSRKVQLFADGVCLGVTWQATKGILSRNIKEFDNTVIFIHNIPVANYEQSTVEKKAGQYHWPYIDEFIKQTHDYQHLQHQSKILAKLDTISLVKVFSGIYSTQELCDYLDTFSQQLSQHNSQFNKPFSLILCDTNHAICITYDIKHSTWILIDANKLPSKKYKSSLEMAKAIEGSLFVTDKAIFSSLMLCNKFDEIFFKKFFATLAEQLTWKKIHRFNSNKMLARDSNKSSLLHLAAHHNDTDTALNLMENNFDSTLIDKWNTTAFATAEENGHSEIADIISEHSDFRCEFFLNYCVSFFKPLITINTKRKRDEVDLSENREHKRMRWTQTND